MLKLGLIGAKLGHSLSPEVQQAIMEKSSVSGEYALYEVPEETAKNIKTWIKERELLGINVTIPYKEHVLECADVLSEEVKSIGAANTLFCQNEKLYAYNTDYLGFIQMFKRGNVVMEGKEVVVLGNGGAARSAIYGAFTAGAKKIMVVGRSEEKSTQLKEKFPYIETVDFEHIQGGDIIINTTPVGMYPNTGKSVVDTTVLQQFLVAVDMVYNPLKTEFLKLAEKEGLQIITGLSMLIDQAVAAQNIWRNTDLDYEIGNTILNDLEKRFI